MTKEGMTLEEFISKAQTPLGVMSMVEYMIIPDSIEEQEKLLTAMDEMPSGTGNAFVMSTGIGKEPQPIDDKGEWRKKLRCWFMQEGGYRYFHDKGIRFQIMADKEMIREGFKTGQIQKILKEKKFKNN